MINEQPLTNPQKLLFWITERNQIRLRKDVGLPKPWSNDPTFQTTYFCNVRREDDRVTSWIRSNYSSHLGDPLFEYNIIFARFINWPETLRVVGYLHSHAPGELGNQLDILAAHGKIWGGAYIITTHGIPMGKVQYLCQNVLGGVIRLLTEPGEPLLRALRPRVAASCSAAHKALQRLEGLGSFLAAQVVADLKNTVGHPLYDAADKRTFVAHGPGSLRGLQWFWQAEGVTITPSNFYAYFQAAREYVDENWNSTLMGPPIDNQDLQNVMCEFDKWMRVSTGVGRSKRNYPGI